MVTYYRQEDDWDEDYSDDDQIPQTAPYPAGDEPASDDEWDDWN